MTAPAQVLVTHLQGTGDANDGAFVTVTMTDNRDRPFVLVLPLTQARALIAPLTAAVGSAHSRQRARLGSDQAVIDHLGLAALRPDGIEVGHASKAGAEPEVLIRLLQNTCPVVDVLISRAAAVDFGLQMQSTINSEPRSRLQ